MDSKYTLSSAKESKSQKNPHQPTNISRTLDFPVVVIGSSVGGLDVLKEIITSRACSLHAAYIITGHYYFCNENDLINFVNLYAATDTVLIQDGMPIEPGKIYINPPNVNVDVKKGIFYLVKSDIDNFRFYLPINYLLNAMALDQGDNVISIILSGIEGFGILSLGKVKKNGGVVIALDPGSTAYCGMPKGAIKTGFVDYVATPEEMTDLLAKLIVENNNAKFLKKNKQPQSMPDGNQSTYDHDLHKLIHELSSKQLILELRNQQLLKTQSELEESRGRYIDLYELAPEGYFTLDKDGKITDVNNAGAELLNIAADDLVNSHLVQYVSEECKDLFARHFNELNQSSISEISELKFIKQDGSYIYARSLGKKLVHQHTGKTEILLCIRDMTLERRYAGQMEKVKLRINNADRLGMIEQFTSTIIHELNQPLGVIANYASGCIRRLNSDAYKKDDLIHAMNQIINMTNRLDDIYQRLKNFKCKNDLSLQVSDINDLIKEALNLIKYEISDCNVSLHYRPALHLPRLMLDKIHIEQVVLHIIRNAIEAMQAANTREPAIIIETEEINGMIAVNITDNGPGFSNNVADRLFNIHFTNRSFGVGLGLAISRTVIEAHGGKISALSNPQGGSSFKISLPVDKRI